VSDHIEHQIPLLDKNQHIWPKKNLIQVVLQLASVGIIKTEESSYIQDHQLKHKVCLNTQLQISQFQTQTHTSVIIMDGAVLHKECIHNQLSSQVWFKLLHIAIRLVSAEKPSDHTELQIPLLDKGLLTHWLNLEMTQHQPLVSGLALFMINLYTI